MTTARLLAEFIGTAFLLLAVVGSGIMGESLAAGNTAISLLANAIATGSSLFVLITILAPISGAHFNPIVTIWSRYHGKLSSRTCLAYLCSQLVGAIFGVCLAHLIFETPLLQVSEHVREGLPQVASEAIATLGLLLTIKGFSEHSPDRIPAGVALYIVAAYWSTSSTSFANPAATLARSLTNTFAGIAPQSLFGFLLAQAGGLGLFLVLERLLFRPAQRADE